MSWRPHGRARITAREPRALGVCDRCGFLYRLRDLQLQYQWAGKQLQSLGLLVCDPCLDIPQQNGLRTLILPADPLPVRNPRPERYGTEIPNFISTESGDPIGTEAGTDLITEIGTTPDPDPNDPSLPAQPPYTYPLPVPD